MPNFKIDENLPTEAAERLLAAGYDAMTLADQQLGGRPDVDIAAVCRTEGRAIVTLDLGFADIRTYPPHDFAGIIVLRLSRVDKQQVLLTIERLLPILNAQPLEGNLWIVDESTVRVRN